MAEEHVKELTQDEAAELARIEGSKLALEGVVDDLSSASRRKRQLSAHVIALLVSRKPDMVAPFIPDLLDALERPEAQTRWEALDALALLAPEHAKECSGAYDGAEAALFDEDSAPLRLSAFHFLTAWGSTERRRSEKVWPILDEAIQCFHGDLEYRDMLGLLYMFASGQVSGTVAEELAGRLQFDAEHGKGAYIKVRSHEIDEMLVKRFKLERPQKRVRVAKSDDTDDNEE